jgi:hypothetical protein
MHHCSIPIFLEKCCDVCATIFFLVMDDCGENEYYSMNNIQYRFCQNFQILSKQSNVVKTVNSSRICQILSKLSNFAKKSLHKNTHSRVCTRGVLGSPATFVSIFYLKNVILFLLLASLQSSTCIRLF